MAIWSVVPGSLHPEHEAALSQSARAMIAEFGDQAWLAALRMHHAALDQGDSVVAAEWTAIANTVTALECGAAPVTSRAQDGCASSERSE